MNRKFDLRVALGLVLGSALGLGACSSSSVSNPFAKSTPKAETVSKPVETPVQRAIVPGVAGEPDVRVRLQAGTGKLQVGSTGGLIWAAEIGGTGGVQRAPARMVAPVQVRLNSVSWELTDAAGLTGRFDRSAELRLLPTADGFASPVAAASSVPAYGTGAPSAGGAAKPAPVTSTATLMIDGRRYPGALCLNARSELNMWSFDVISQVGVEDYLRGVVASEMYSSWPLAAFQAQAVAARSYALHERQRSRLNGARFDVESTTADQAYKGGEYTPQVQQAVESTRGVILTWNGIVLRAYYSSTSGGRAASAKDTWPTSRGYEYNLMGPLQATPREEIGQTSPYYRWTVSRGKAELSMRIREWGRAYGQPVKDLGTLAQVAVADRNSVGRPTRYVVTDTAGRSFSVTAEQFRQACNQPGPGLAAIVRENRVNSGDVEVQLVGEVATIRGRGFGHGVGMCQWSAKELAERGADWRSIVTRFYPGAVASKAY